MFSLKKGLFDLFFVVLLGLALQENKRLEDEVKDAELKAFKDSVKNDFENQLSFNKSQFDREIGIANSVIENHAQELEYARDRCDTIQRNNKKVIKDLEDIITAGKAANAKLLEEVSDRKKAHRGLSTHVEEINKRCEHLENENQALIKSLRQTESNLKDSTNLLKAARADIDLLKMTEAVNV